MKSSRWLSSLVVGALLASPVATHAQSKKECAAAYVAGQRARNEGKLGEAHERLAICASPACPTALRGDCASWLDEVDRARPVLTVRVTGAHGDVVLGARVTLDGIPLADGAAQPVEPGDHVVRVEADSAKPAEQRVTIASGSRRELNVTLEPAQAVAPTTTPAPSRAAPIALGVVGLVSLGAFAALGAVGNGKKGDLDASGCKVHGCAPADVGAVKTLYVAADVALGAGLAALVASGILWIVGPSATTSQTTFIPSIGIGPQRASATVTVQF